jgi:hypothetical protein
MIQPISSANRTKTTKPPIRGQYMGAHHIGRLGVSEAGSRVERDLLAR